MHQALSDRGRAVWIGAQDQARTSADHEVDTAHLLLALTTDHAGIAHDALDELGATSEAVRRAAPENTTRSNEEPDQRVRLAADLQTVFSTVMRQAPSLGPRRVEPHHFLLALVEHPENAGARILLSLGIPLADVRAAVARRLGLGGHQD